MFNFFVLISFNKLRNWTKKREGAGGKESDNYATSVPNQKSCS